MGNEYHMFTNGHHGSATQGFITQGDDFSKKIIVPFMSVAKRVATIAKPLHIMLLSVIY